MTVCSTDTFDVQLDKAGGAKMGLALNQDANGGKSLAIANVAELACILGHLKTIDSGVCRFSMILDDSR